MILPKNLEEELNNIICQAILCGGISSNFQQTVTTSVDSLKDFLGQDHRRIMFYIGKFGSWLLKKNNLVNEGLEESLVLNEELILNIKNDLGNWIDEQILWVIGAIIPLYKGKIAKPNLKRFGEPLNVDHINCLGQEFDENGISHDDRYIALHPSGIERLCLSIRDFRKDAISAIAKDKFYLYRGFHFTCSKLVQKNQALVWQKKHVLLSFQGSEDDLNKIKMVWDLHKEENQFRGSEVKLNMQIYIGALRISERGTYSLSYNDPVRLIGLNPTWR